MACSYGLKNNNKQITSHCLIDWLIVYLFNNEDTILKYFL